MYTENDIKHIWNDVLRTIKDIVPIEVYETWFVPIRPIKIDGDVIRIEVPSQFFYEYIETNFVDMLFKTIKKVVGRPLEIEYSIVIDPYQQKSVQYPTSRRNSAQQGIDDKIGNGLPKFDVGMNPFVIPGMRLGQIHSQLNPAYTFDNFIEGNCNRIARSAGLQIVEKFGKNPFNPLVIYSESGLGKTHLVNAIGNAAKTKHPSLNVLYVSAEKFINQFISNSKSNQITDFINFYQQIDLLIVDDAHSFVKAEKTQEAFFAIFNHLHQSDKQIILTLDRPPQELVGLQERLLSRFRWGLTAELESPDYETRLAILHSKMKKDGIIFSPQVVEYIAKNIKGNVRELEGIIVSLLAHASFDKREIDLELVAKIIKNRIRTTTVIHSVEDIQLMVASLYNLTIDNLKSKLRKREYVEARHLSMYLIKNYTQNSLKTIGQHFGGRDHTTVIHACTSIENLMVTDEQFREKLNSIKNKLSKV